MDSKEGSDEECLDLEALEALLEKDDNDQEDDQQMSDGTESPNRSSKELDQKSLDDFFDAASDSEDERVPNQINSDEYSRNSNNSSESPMTRREITESACVDSEAPASVQPEQSSVDPATKALQEEMAQMQKRMMELQKMLENRAPIESPQDTSIKERQRSLTSSKNDRADAHKGSVKPNATSKKIFQEQIEKQAKEKKPENQRGCQQSTLKLIDEAGESPFFDSPSAKSVSREDKMKIREEVRVNPRANGRPQTKRMEKELFGDSDSDWEELDGEDKQTLSEAGQELKRIMNSKEKTRVAHTSKFGTPDLSGGASSSWARFYSEQESESGRKKKAAEKVVRNTLQCKSSSSDQSKPTNSGAEEEPSVTDAYSKIRIVNPLISHSLMKMRMEGRKMISIPRIHLKMKTQEVQGDWVTIGVVVGKSEPKTSSAGNPYSIWKLNDLEDLENSVSFFLFGEKHKQLWKTGLGTVIGVLNPGIMDALDKSSNEPALTVHNASQVMMMGHSKDLAWCTSLTKGGNKCCKFINRRQGDFCAYHVQAAYRKQSAQRLELHGSVTGIKPRSFEQKIFSKGCAYVYGGQTFVPHSRADSGKTKKGVTLSKLQNSMTEGRYQKVNTLSIHDIKPRQAEHRAGGGKIKEDPNDTFLDMISMPSAGSMNFVAHLKNPGGKGTSAGSGSPKPGPGASALVQSVSAKDLMKMHKQDMDKKRLAQKQQGLGLAMKADPLKLQPRLGKGLGHSQEVLLDVGGSRQSGKGLGHSQEVLLDVGGSRQSGKADFAKLKAIAAIKQMGGIEKQDPNAVKKSGDKVKEKVKRRVEEDHESSSSSSPGTVAKRQPDGSRSSSKSSRPGEPPKKKSKLLGDVDLNSDEVKAILKAKSKHKGVLAEAEAEREEAYFCELEKREKLEEKMQSVTSIEITVVTCKLCMYTAQSAKDSCKKDGHTLKRGKAKKRFFKCKKCKHRTYVIDAKFPTQPCRKCGEMSYEKTSMCPIRSGPKLDSEVLIERGDEVKNLNSLDQKVYLNTVIDD